jgi:hypothetical protein
MRKKYISCSYIKGKENLIIILKKYYIRVNRLFVFQSFSNVFKKGFCKIEKSSLGLAKRDKVSEKEEVVNKNTNKKAYKL